MGDVRGRSGSRGRRGRVGVVIGLSVAVWLLGVAVRAPGVGLGFLYLGPTLLAAGWLGRRAAVATGVLGAALFVTSALFVPQPQLGLSALLRLVVFCAVGYAAARLIDTQVALRLAVAARDTELAELRGIRSALTPAEVPERPALDLASCFVPAEQVGGDFYVVAAGPAETTVLVVGDVAGKGIEAARQASFVRTALTAFAPFTDDPSRLLELANYSLIEKSGGRIEAFVTAVCVTFRPQDGALALALAGHPPPLRLDDGAEIDGVRPGMPLGVGIDLRCEVAHTRLEVGDGVLLFTDGLPEARRARSPETTSGNGHAREDRAVAAAHLFGTSGIERALTRLRGEDPRTVVRALHAAAEEFAGGALADDLCLVAARARIR